MNRNSFVLKDRIMAVTRYNPGFFAAAVIDARTGRELLECHQPLRSASLIKLFIMAEAFCRMEGGSLLPDETIVIRESDRVGGAGVLQTEPAGVCRTVMELTELMITESDNIATNLLIERLGMESVNGRIRGMGCLNSRLNRLMMDFGAAAAGRENFTTASDIARTLLRIHRGTCVSETADRTMRAILGRQTDRCKIPSLLPAGTLCQHKTGELPGAEHDAGIVHGPSGPYVLCLMGEDLPDPEEGRQLLARLSRLVYDFFQEAVCPPGRERI